MMKLKNKYAKLILSAAASLMICAACAIRTGATEVQNGVWKVKYGNPESFSLLDATKIKPQKKALDSLSKSELPIKIEDVKYELRDGKVYLRFPLDYDEQIYGLGLNFQRVNQRGIIKDLRMDIYHGRDDGRTHAPVPFFVSSKGYGVLINSARKLDVYCGTTQFLNSPNSESERDRTTDPNWKADPYSDSLEVLVPADGVELYFFSGKNLKEVVQRYNLYCGGGTLPARWAFGFWHRVPLAFSEEEALNETEELIKRGYPFSVLGLEPGWQSNSYPCTYEWDASRFPNPKNFLEKLNEMGVKANLWMNGYVSKKSSLYDVLKVFFADHTVWGGAVPDYSMQEVRKIFTDAFKKNHVDIGVGGYKLDENDGNDYWLYPDTTLFPSGISAEQFRQTHAVFMARMINDLYKKSGTRTFGLVRGMNAGANSYPFVVYSDHSNHQEIVTAAVTSSFIGVLWTPEACDAGGGDEWLKRIQSVAWSPLAMLNAWASQKKPWSFEDVAEDVKECFRLRARMVPYIYNAFAAYQERGIPPLRAMLLEESFSDLMSDNNAKLSDEYKALAKDVNSQWMFGEDILVAPMFAGQNARKVLLPAGKWFDFYTGKYVGESEVVTADFDANNKKIPVYVRDGALIPMLADADKDCKKLVVRHYGNKPSKSELYDDDGTSFDFLKGKFVKFPLEVEVSQYGEKRGKLSASPNTLFNYNEVVFEFMTK